MGWTFAACRHERRGRMSRAPSRWATGPDERMVDGRTLIMRQFGGRLSFAAPRAYKERMSRISDRRKQSLYFPEEMLREIQEEATRQDRSLSWIMQHAWRSARARIGNMPGTDDLGRRAGPSRS